MTQTLIPISRFGYISCNWFLLMILIADMSFVPWYYLDFCLGVINGNESSARIIIYVKPIRGSRNSVKIKNKIFYLLRSTKLVLQKRTYLLIENFFGGLFKRIYTYYWGKISNINQSTIFIILYIMVRICLLQGVYRKSPTKNC